MTKKEIGGILLGASEQASAKGYQTSLLLPCVHAKEEIRKAIIQLKNVKAAGPDDIPTEVLKVDSDTSVEILYPLLGMAWEKNEVPTEWKKGYFVKLPKKQI